SYRDSRGRAIARANLPLCSGALAQYPRYDSVTREETMIRGLHHIAINTANLQRLVDFYAKVIGFEIVHEGAWENSPVLDAVIGLKGSASKIALLRAGNCYLELFEYISPQPRDTAPLRPCDRGYTHLCLDMTDIEQEYERLTAAGMKFN